MGVTFGLQVKTRRLWLILAAALRGQQFNRVVVMCQPVMLAADTAQQIGFLINWCETTTQLGGH